MKLWTGLLGLVLAFSLFTTDAAAQRLLGQETTRVLQQRLSDMGYAIVVDGQGGPATRRTLEQFYDDAGVTPRPTDIDEDAGFIVMSYAERGFRNPAGNQAIRSRPQTAGPGPSFDCARAGTPTERAICSNAELARLDRNLGRVYSQLRRSLPADGAERLRRDQREFISGRDACGADIACIDTAYRFRLDYMVVYQ
jgi:hypothetical protein